jgi:hypothetical protein
MNRPSKMIDDEVKWWDPEIQNYLFRYTDTDWQKIKKPLTDIGIDPDAVTLIGPPIPRLKLRYRSTKDGALLLLDALQHVARIYCIWAEAKAAGEKLDLFDETPRQQVGRLQKAQAAFEAARASLQDAVLAYSDLSEDEWQARLETHCAADTALKQIAGWVEQRLPTLNQIRIGGKKCHNDSQLILARLDENLARHHR